MWPDVKDDVLTSEVMTDHLDGGWWKAYKEELKAGFGQEEILIRRIQTERL